jgi:mannose-6-phosphate isomerase-like protein (cupin superfamily)
MSPSTNALPRTVGLVAVALALGSCLGYLHGAGRAAAAEAPSPVIFFSHTKVEDGFRKGSVLFHDPQRNYQVHTSHRDGPGEAELHDQDTDIFYIQSGTATFVTGGKMVGARAEGPGETRGRAIDGGEPHRLVKGDVIIVPHGTPHWFREVQGPFNYFTVKVR